MPDYRSMFDRNYLYSFDLKGKDLTVEIARVEAGKLQIAGTTQKQSKPVLYFKTRNGQPGPGLALNKTNAKVVAKLYGTNTDQWVGKKLTLYPTTTKFGAETVDCIRIKPTVPRGEAESGPESTLPPHEPPGADGAAS